MAFKFYNNHFYFRNCHVRALFCRFTANQAKIRKTTTKLICEAPWASHISKMTFLAFPQKKPYIKTSKNTFFRHIWPNCSALRQKSKYSDTFRELHKISKLSDISSRILVCLKKADDSCLTAVNQMVGGSGTKLSHKIARSKIDLPNVCFKNVQSAFVYPYEASEISKIT